MQQEETLKKKFWGGFFFINLDFIQNKERGLLHVLSRFYDNVALHSVMYVSDHKINNRTRWTT